MKIELLSINLVNFLTKAGLSLSTAKIVETVILLLLILLVSAIANFVTKKIIINILKHIIIKTKNKFDDVFLENNVFNSLSHIVPALIIYYSIPFAISKEYSEIIQSFTYIYIIIVVMVVLNLFLNSLHDIYLKLPVSKEINAKGYIQVIKIIFYVIGIILILSVLIGKSPTTLLTGLGAMTAILLLVFKDTILGFVASIQLSSYKMLKRGDWISMPSRKADGNVLDITLNTVKVQNFNKTISTIPTHVLMSESFVNWEGMRESGGRRIKRSINIDMKSIKFCDEKMIEKLKKISLIKNYLEEKQNELVEYNLDNNIDNSVVVNGRRITNIGTFRKYVERYLVSNLQEVKFEKYYDNGIEKEKEVVVKEGKFKPDMTLIVRQLQPSEKGLPIEIYVFTSTVNWVEYEAIQADIFDHILAIVPEFGLKIFQNPTGEDFLSLSNNFSSKS